MSTQRAYQSPGYSPSELFKLIYEVGITILHDLNFAATYCDRLYLLAGGMQLSRVPLPEVSALPKEETMKATS